MGKKTKLCKHGYLIAPLQRGILHRFTEQATIHCLLTAECKKNIMPNNQMEESITQDVPF
jgi:hypothetical protein